MSTSNLTPYSVVSAELDIPMDILTAWLKRKRWGLFDPVVIDGVYYIQRDTYEAWSRQLRQLIVNSLRPSERARLEAETKQARRA